MSAYKLAMDLRQQVERGCSSNDGALKKKKIWRRYGAYKFLIRLSILVGGLCKDIPPCLSNLKKRGVLVDDRCEQCDEEVKSSGHLCLNHNFAAKYGELSSIFQTQHIMQFQSFMDLLWFLWDSKQCNDDTLSLAIVIAWAMWTRRNEKGNGKKVLSGPMLI